MEGSHDRQGHAEGLRHSSRDCTACIDQEKKGINIRDDQGADDTPWAQHCSHLACAALCSGPAEMT